MQILVNRDSVTAGDDATGHQWTLTIADDATLGDALTEIGLSFLPYFEGGGRGTWLVKSGEFHGSSLAVVTEDITLYIVDAATQLAFADPRIDQLYYRYYLAADPQSLYEKERNAN